MSIFQVLRILWARRLIIIGATVSCLIGALVLLAITPPRWTGTARVMLNLLKPDPVTGQFVGGPSAKTYFNTQSALITDAAVAGKVAEDLGWLSDPGLIRAYRNRPAQDTRDFRHWVSEGVITRTKVNNPLGSNILEITYTSSRADEARAVAEALRRAYMEQSLIMRREEATRNADWFIEQADKARTALDKATNEVAQFERDNGIVMADQSTDVDTARLRSLAQQSDVQVPTVIQPGGSGSVAQLAAMDAQIADATKNLGPNHPQLQTLRTQRKALADLIAKEESERASANAKANALRAGAVQAQLSAQKAKVIGQRDKLAHLAELQSQVVMLKAQFDRTQQRAADLRMEANASDAGISALGTATVPSTPSWPKKPLIIWGAVAAGLGMGVLLALLVELFARRVRSAEDLRYAVDAPMLAVISGPGSITARSVTRRFSRQLNWPMRRKAVQG